MRGNFNRNWLPVAWWNREPASGGREGRGCLRQTISGRSRSWRNPYWRWKSRLMVETRGSDFSETQILLGSGLPPRCFYRWCTYALSLYQYLSIRWAGNHSRRNFSHCEGKNEKYLRNFVTRLVAAFCTRYILEIRSVTEVQKQTKNVEQHTESRIKSQVEYVVEPPWRSSSQVAFLRAGKYLCIVHSEPLRVRLVTKRFILLSYIPLCLGFTPLGFVLTSFVKEDYIHSTLER